MFRDNFTIAPALVHKNIFAERLEVNIGSISCHIQLLVTTIQ
jgi:hypothetical protein